MTTMMAMRLHRVVVCYVARRRIRLGRDRYGSREETDQVRLLVQAEDEAGARRRAIAWFEAEVAAPTAGIRFGNGLRDAVAGEIRIAQAAGIPVVEVYEEDGDVVVLS